MPSTVKRAQQTPRTKVSSKNQITLPVAALLAAGVRSGDILRVEVVADGVFRLVRERSRIDAIAGTLPGVSAAADLEAERDAWER